MGRFLPSFPLLSDCIRRVSHSLKIRQCIDEQNTNSQRDGSMDRVLPCGHHVRLSIVSQATVRTSICRIQRISHRPIGHHQPVLAAVRKRLANETLQ